MRGRFKRSYYKSNNKEKEKDEAVKDIETFTSKDNSVTTIVKKEKINKNYRFNKLLINDEDAKIIQEFIRAKLKLLIINKNEENKKQIQKEQEDINNSSNNSKEKYLSKYKQKLSKEKGSLNENICLETKNNINSQFNKSKKINEYSQEHKIINKKNENNKGLNNNKKILNKEFKNNLQKSNNNKANNEIEENNSINLERIKISKVEKKIKKEENYKFIQAYHEKKSIENNNSSLTNKINLNDKNCKYQLIEVIPVRFYCDNNENSRKEFHSNQKPIYVKPYLNVDYIITNITTENNYISNSKDGYKRDNNNINFNNKPSLFKNENQYKNEYKSIRLFTYSDNLMNKA